ncbi:MAG: 30S ribosomal protein S15 [Candidatus Colwellbacteria bacterium]|nr:30S ribosomal protein S15 [Candidatus Colwellbacteria bacterium]
MITSKKKQAVIKEHQTHETDTGSAQVQVAVTTERIKELITHLRKHPKDKHSRRGLLALVNQRRKFLSYLLKNSPQSYRNIIKKLGLKKTKTTE